MSELFPYMGGKFYLADFILSFLPEHRCYAEPFAGSLAVLLAKTPSEVETANDTNREIVNFYRVLREAGECEPLLRRLEWLLEMSPVARSQFRDWVIEWNQGWRPQDPVERAAVWYYLMCNNIAHADRMSPGQWSFSPVKNLADAWQRRTRDLRGFARRLAKVQFECDDFRAVIPRWDREDTVFYCDPPYDLESRGRTKEYYGVFTETDHRDLAGLLKQVKGKVILSYYHSPLVDSLYDGWYHIDINQAKMGTVAYGEGSKPVGVEVLYFNYIPDPLFRWRQEALG